MPLTPTTDLAAARWIEDAAAQDGDWWRTSSLGPPGYDACVRVLHPLADGEVEDDDEALLQHEGDLEPSVLLALRDVLGDHTGTPGRCWYCLWDGFGDVVGGSAVAVVSSTGDSPEVEPAFSHDVLAGPRVRLPHRDFLLFSGALRDAGEWGAHPYPGGEPRTINSPNLFWPDDRAWCVATDIDSPWTAVVGSRALAAALLADPRLDVVETDRDVPDPPRYR